MKEKFNSNKPEIEVEKEKSPVEKIGHGFNSILEIIDKKDKILATEQEIRDHGQLKQEISNIAKELQLSMNRLNSKDKESLSQEEINDEILNIPAQIALLNEIIKNSFIDTFRASNKGEPIFDAKDIGQIISKVSDINNVIDKLSLPQFENKYEFSELTKALQKAEKTRGGGYGKLVGGIARKTGEKITKAQTRVFEAIKNKINSEKFKRFVDRLQNSRALPKLAAGVTFLALGFLASNPFRNLEAQVDAKIEDDSLKLDINGLKIENTRISDLNKYLATEKISNDILDQVYNIEIELDGVNYSIENPEAYRGFIENEMDRVILEVEKIAGRDIDKAELKPDEWVLISSKIAEDNIEYNDLDNDLEVEKINNMPLDKLIMDYHKGVCRHYAAAVESISNNIKEISDSPYLKNIKIEELVVDVVGATTGGTHGINIIMAKVNEEGQDKLKASYICSTWDDDGKFADDLEIIPQEESYRDTSRSFIRSLVEKDKDLFTSEDLIKIYTYIAENYPSFSAERIAADSSLINYYYDQATDYESDAETREDAFNNMKKFILDQGFKKRGELYGIDAYRNYLQDYDFFKSQAGSEEHNLDLISEYMQASSYDRQRASYYHYKLGALYQGRDNISEAENHYLICLDSFDKINDENVYFSWIPDSVKKIEEIYNKQGHPEKMLSVYEKTLNTLDIYLESLGHNLDDHRGNTVVRFLNHFLDYFEENDKSFSNTIREKLIRVASKLGSEGLRDNYINIISNMNL